MINHGCTRGVDFSYMDGEYDKHFIEEGLLITRKLKNVTIHQG